ncbi:hypothetical protein LINPERPRIM_LOCUS22344, partial [Linum perenne]
MNKAGMKRMKTFWTPHYLIPSPTPGWVEKENVTLRLPFGTKQWVGKELSIVLTHNRHLPQIVQTL